MKTSLGLIKRRRRKPILAVERSSMKKNRVQGLKLSQRFRPSLNNNRLLLNKLKKLLKFKSQRRSRPKKQLNKLRIMLFLLLLQLP